MTTPLQYSENSVTSTDTKRTHSKTTYHPQPNSPDVEERPAARFARISRAKSLSLESRVGLEDSDLISVRRRTSLIPSFLDTKWHLSQCLQCSELKNSSRCFKQKDCIECSKQKNSIECSELQSNCVEGKHDGISGEHLRPLLSLWKFAGDQTIAPAKVLTKQRIQRQCGCVVRTS
jgi:hypothetical protein